MFFFFFFFVEDSIWLGLTSIQASIIWKKKKKKTTKKPDTIPNLNKSEPPNLFEPDSNVVPSILISFGFKLYFFL